MAYHSMRCMHTLIRLKCHKPILLTSRLPEERNTENESGEVSSGSQKEQLKT